MWMSFEQILEVKPKGGVILQILCKVRAEQHSDKHIDTVARHKKGGAI